MCNYTGRKKVIEVSTLCLQMIAKCCVNYNSRRKMANMFCLNDIYSYESRNS